MPASADRLSAFLEAVAPLTSASLGELDRLARTALAIDGLQHAPPGLSAMNNDGSPLEVCLTLRPGGWSARLIADPTYHCVVPRERAVRSTAVLDRVFERAGAAELIAAARHSLQATTADVDPALYRNGVLWLAESVGGRGAAVYIDASPQGLPGGWETARRWVRQVLPGPAAALDDLDLLSSWAEVASYSLEGTGPRDARAKVYFRMREVRPLAEWGVAAFSHPRYPEILALLLGDRDVSVDGLVGSVGYALATGDRTGSKIDLCGHCIDQDASEWVATLRACCTAAGVVFPPVEETLHAASVAFIGIGLTTAGETRLNLYLKPASTQFTGVERAIGRGIQYLIGIQEPDGSWWDFELPAGRSDQWVTAYAGYALALAGHRWADAQSAARRAAEWLEEHRTAPAGWGFNAGTGSDADSTAFALALFEELRLPVSEADRRFLLEHWQAGGGFSTYTTADAWGGAHPDVTPLAYRVLGSQDKAEREGPLLDYLERCRIDGGVWPSYWWRNESYATFAVAELLGAGAVLGKPRVDPENLFDLACGLGVASIAGAGERNELLARLLGAQRGDGAWSGSANLRVTHPDCDRPWERPAAAGDYYEDFRATITTATALRALIRC